MQRAQRDVETSASLCESFALFAVKLLFAIVLNEKGSE